MTESRFIEELSNIGIKVSELQIKQLNKYQYLLNEWNKVINLTGITEKNEVYLKHFYDSLTIFKVVNLYNIENLCDVGSGAGFPGLVLKILFPQLKVVLIDSLNKRINFLNDVINKLELKGIEALHMRSEDYAKNNKERFDIVTARAVAPLPILIELCVPLVKVDKYFIPLKANIENEINNSTNAEKELCIVKDDIVKFKLPIEESNRTIIRYKKFKKTNLKYPRKYSDIKKKTL